MEIITCKNYEELCSKTSELIFKRLNQIILAKRKAVIALPGGRSIVGVLKGLKNYNLNWNKIEIFLIDERMVSINDKESNFKLIHDNLSLINNLNIHSFDLNQGVQDYTYQFHQAGGKFDLVVLGVGEDGHIAGLFPHHKSLSVTEKKYVEINDAPKPPPRRITASPGMIKCAGTVVLLFVSGAKKKAYEDFMNKKTNLKECPAKLVLEAKDVYVMKDF